MKPRSKSSMGTIMGFDWFHATSEYTASQSGWIIPSPSFWDWDSGRPDSEIQFIGAYAILQDAGYQATDTLPDPDETYNFHGWWSPYYQPLSFMSSDERGEILYGDGIGLVHQPTDAHFHLKNFWAEANGATYLIINNDDENASSEWHDKNEYYDLHCWYFEVDDWDADAEGLMDVDQYRTTDSVQTANDTIQFSMAHYQTELDGSWVYHVSDTAIYNFMEAHEGKKMVFYLTEFDY